MAFRSEAPTGAALAVLLCSTFAAAEPLTFAVRHRHLRHEGQGSLRVTEDGIRYEESGKGAAHSRQWKFEEIEQLTLGTATLRVRTYEDRRWPLSEREFVFEGVPREASDEMYTVFRARLDQRFVAALADAAVQPKWEVSVKLLGHAGRSQGVLLIGTDRVVYRTEARDQARTWRIPDIEMVSSSGPFDLTITTFERAGGPESRRDFHFNLKRALAEHEYQALWRRVNQVKGLQVLGEQQ
jgi:hypothetical protein